MVFQAGDIAVAEAGQGIAHETAQLRDAIAALRARLAAGTHGQDILAAHMALLEDPEIEAVCLAQVSAGKSAGFAFRHAIRGQAEIFGSMAEPRLRERAADFLDLERQLLSVLTGKTPAPTQLPERAIVLADELLPSELLALDAGRLAGIATSRGGPTSHVAILAAAMGVPALVGVGEALKHVPAGREVLLDADAGILHINPDVAVTSAARARIDALVQARVQAQAAATSECRTADGTRIEVFANLGSGRHEAAKAVAMGAEGCGLLRTEFLFMERDAPPGEQEQFEIYQGIADALGARPLILRTFDIGGDKPAPYLPFPREDNPMMGLRGIRAGFHWPDLLRTQLSAALRVRPQCRILLPMVSSVADVRKVRALIAELDATAQASLGVMVETPASALMADQLIAEADFLSIGTNDLTQYVLAMDRGNPLLAGQIDALHPAVLRLIAKAAEAGAAAGKPAGLCGGLAAETLAAPLLIGLGVSELSMPPAIIPSAKAAIAAVTLAQCRALAVQALALDSAAAVRALLQRGPA
jgi:phosphocarrier protein FPr/phosphocarrier protein